MPRTLDPAAHASRRDAFVDSAQRLMATKGYEQLSIQEVITDTGASKGAFYHYFDSKAALLDAVIERMVQQAMALITPIVADAQLPALDKIRTLFDTLARWKLERSDLVLALLRVWTADENAIVREKYRRRSAAIMTPTFGGIVAQGVAEGTFTTAHPERTARVLMGILADASETAVDLFLAAHAGRISIAQAEEALQAYPEACERLLGLPPDTFPVIHRNALRAWFA